jgi:hypothetical protein
MSAAPVSVSEFQERLAALCGAADGGFPRKLRDRHILFRSVVALLDAGRRYSEPELNAAIGRWSAAVGEGIGIDYVTLRRYLVDWGYLCRDPDGTTYSVRRDGAGDVTFGSDVDGMDPIAIVQEARLEARIRKRLWQATSHPGSRTQDGRKDSWR